jgi:hypothetical protein
MSNATLNENTLSTKILFLSNISHVLIKFIEISLFSGTCSSSGCNSSRDYSSRDFFTREFVQKVLMDQFSLLVLWVRLIQERRFHFLIFFSSGESYPLHQ